MKLVLDRCAGDLLSWNPSERLRWFRGSVEVRNPLDTAVDRVAYYYVEGLYLLRLLLRVMLAVPLRVTCAAQCAKTTKVPLTSANLIIIISQVTHV